MTSLIQSLFACCCPAAVFFCVASVDVNPVNAHSFRSLTHVLQEVSEFEPSVANTDSSASIQIKLEVIVVGASLFHCVPTSVRACSITFPRHAMRREPCGANFSSKASAASCFLASQLTEVHADSRATIAFTNPKCLSVYSRIKLTGHEFSKPYSSCVNFVVPATWNTPTGFCSARSQRIGRNYRLVSAFALTQPFSTSCRIVFGTFDNGQPVECFSGEVFKSAHSQVSFGTIIHAKTRISKACLDVVEVPVDG